jgi:hypothetical protein
MQIPGVNYTESFQPVASDTDIRVVIGIFLYYLQLFPRDEWELETLDVEVAFLNALLSYPVYIEWTKGLKELRLLSKEECDSTHVRGTDKSNVWKYRFTPPMDEDFYQYT